MIAPFIGIKLIDLAIDPLLALWSGMELSCHLPSAVCSSKHLTGPTRYDPRDVNALVACLVTFLLCAVAYPAVVWGWPSLTFPHEAEGSLVYSRDRTVIGSELIAQPFASDKYFYPRPSAVDYKADAAGGSNLGTKNPDLRKKIAERAEALKATATDPAPVDLVTASGSGLDPHISPEAANYQAARVAAARKLPVERVRETDRSARRALRGDHRRSAARQRAPPEPCLDDLRSS